MIKAGIAGLGWWGQNLVRSVQGKSDVISFTVGAVRHPEKAAEFADEQGLTLFEGLDSMLVGMPPASSLVSSQRDFPPLLRTLQIVSNLLTQIP